MVTNAKAAASWHALHLLGLDTKCSHAICNMREAYPGKQAPELFGAHFEFVPAMHHDSRDPLCLPLSLG